MKTKDNEQTEFFRTLKEVVVNDFEKWEETIKTACPTTLTAEEIAQDKADTETVKAATSIAELLEAVRTAGWDQTYMVMAFMETVDKSPNFTDLDVWDLWFAIEMNPSDRWDT